MPFSAIPCDCIEWKLTAEGSHSAATSCHFPWHLMTHLPASWDQHFNLIPPPLLKYLCYLQAILSTFTLKLSTDINSPVSALIIFLRQVWTYSKWFLIALYDGSHCFGAAISSNSVTETSLDLHCLSPYTVSACSVCAALQ